jgi:hypothetical protein
MFINRFSVTLIALGASVACNAQPARSATVNLRIVDYYGNTVQYKIKSFHSTEEPRIELVGNAHGLVVPVELGKTYLCRLAPAEPQKYPAFEKRVVVEEQETFLVFSVREAMYSGDDLMAPPPFQFRITPTAQLSEPSWVTVRPAFAPPAFDDDNYTAIVSLNGTFSLRGVAGGLYLITICSKNKMLRVVVVEIPRAPPTKPIDVRMD